MLDNLVGIADGGYLLTEAVDKMHGYDFTIRHPKSGRFFYWEHFGLMTSPSYSQNVFQKLNTYCQNNIIPTINLITTYETREYPLTSQTIENIIQEYFIT